jgi:hypothetical protein
MEASSDPYDELDVISPPGTAEEVVLEADRVDTLAEVARPLGPYEVAETSGCPDASARTEIDDEDELTEALDAG